MHVVYNILTVLYMRWETNLCKSRVWKWTESVSRASSNRFIQAVAILTKTLTRGANRVCGLISKRCM